MYQRPMVQDMSQQQLAVLWSLKVSPEERQKLFQTVAEWVFERMYHPKDGYTPVKGKDYVDGKTPTNKELLELIKSCMPTDAQLLKLIKPLLPTKKDLQNIIEPLIPFVENGKDGVSPNEDDLRKLIEPLVRTVVSEMGQAEGKEPTYDQIVGAATPIIEQKMREARKGWFGGGGGGDLVRAGDGITITTNGIGAKVISATGGAGSWSTPAETPNGSTTVFTVTAEPTDVVADGITYYDGAGYTYASLSITFDSAPVSYVRYR